jgi:hypothetical protein
VIAPDLVLKIAIVGLGFFSTVLASVLACFRARWPILKIAVT